MMRAVPFVVAIAWLSMLDPLARASEAPSTIPLCAGLTIVTAADAERVRESEGRRSRRAARREDRVFVRRAGGRTERRGRAAGG